METYQFIILVVLTVAAIAVGVAAIVIIPKKNKASSEELSAMRTEIVNSTQNSVKNMGDMIAMNQQSFSAAQSEKMSHLEDRFKTFSLENEQKLENIRVSMERGLDDIREDNNKQLAEMRMTVDQRLQKTLEEKMNQSFSLVSQRLEQVYKGLGEMQNLAVGVGDLKKVLSNVKTRGIVGEIQLGSILEEILTPDQYDTNVATKHGSRDVVEFAVKLPARDDGFIYLPIDSKFPGDSYAALRDAYDSGSKEAVDAATKTLLNSIQMGFKTLAVQKRSAEVWKLLGSVKKEFETFNSVLVATQTKLDQANKELDKLVGVRSRQISRKLSAVESNDTPVSAYFSTVDQYTEGED